VSTLLRFAISFAVLMMICGVTAALWWGDISHSAIQPVDMHRWRYGVGLSALGAALVTLATVLPPARPFSIVLTLGGALLFVNWLLPMHAIYVLLYLLLYDGITDIDILRFLAPIIDWIAAAAAAQIVALVLLLLAGIGYPRARRSTT
jgi:hypothetical protein